MARNGRCSEGLKRHAPEVTRGARGRVSGVGARRARGRVTEGPGRQPGSWGFPGKARGDVTGF